MTREIYGGDGFCDHSIDEERGECIYCAAVVVEPELPPEAPVMPAPTPRC